jgi:mannose-6-phosphate isomerase-like protein (cupin superfamily)
MHLRKFITGVDEEGRSCVIEEGDIAPTPVPGMPEVAIDALYRIDQSPPPPGLPHRSVEVDHFLPPGHLRWTVVQHAPVPEDAAPTTSAVMHYSDLVAMFIVVAGSTTMVLDRDERELFPGDCVVMNGVDHAMVVGPEGSTLITASIGTPPSTT